MGKLCHINFWWRFKKINTNFLNRGYKGKLLGLLGIGDRLDLIKDDFNFYFEGDAHYLEYKEDSDMSGEIIPAEILTNYRVAYSEEYPDQIVEGVRIYAISPQWKFDIWLS